jgi:CheY-like chemotaxis protein
MQRHLKVLMLEDTDEDIHLILRELSKSGIQYDYKVVDAKPDFEAALNEFNPDVILSDHSMPMFNSLEALVSIKEFQKKTGKRIPFILVTGTVSGEFAEQCIRAGADDYILKDHLKRLPEVIRKAMEKELIKKTESDPDETQDK